MSIFPFTQAQAYYIAPLFLTAPKSGKGEDRVGCSLSPTPRLGEADCLVLELPCTPSLLWGWCRWSPVSTDKSCSQLLVPSPPPINQVLGRGCDGWGRSVLLLLPDFESGRSPPLSGASDSGWLGASQGRRCVGLQRLPNAPVQELRGLLRGHGWGWLQNTAVNDSQGARQWRISAWDQIWTGNLQIQGTFHFRD